MALVGVEAQLKDLVAVLVLAACFGATLVTLTLRLLARLAMESATRGIIRRNEEFIFWSPAGHLSLEFIRKSFFEEYEAGFIHIEVTFLSQGT